jgi:hypothetical protein
LTLWFIPYKITKSTGRGMLINLNTTFAGNKRSKEHGAWSIAEEGGKVIR